MSEPLFMTDADEQLQDQLRDAGAYPILLSVIRTWSAQGKFDAAREKGRS